MVKQLETSKDVENLLFAPADITFKQEPEKEIKDEELSPENQEDSKSKNEENKSEESSSDKDQTDSKDTQDKKEQEEIPSFLKVLRLEKVPETAEEIQKVLKSAAKSVHDNRTNWDKEHLSLLESQKTLDLNKEEMAKLKEEIEDVSSKISEKEESDQKLSNEQFVAKFQKKFDENPEDAVKEMVLAVRQEFSEKSNDDERIAEIVGKQVLGNQEKICKAQHDDYEEVMQVFLPVFTHDEGLQDKWDEKGRTADAAYEMAKEYKEHQDILNDPEAYRKKIIEEHEKSKKTESENDNHKNDPSFKLSGVGSKRNGSSGTKARQLANVEDVMDTLDFR